MSWIDISAALNHQVAEWPGDTPFSYSIPVTKADSGSVNIGRLEMSTHIGTHIDAPFHFDNDGKTVEQLDINNYIGTATVVHLEGIEEISAKALKDFSITGHILLIKTGAARDKSIFPDDVPTLTQEAVDYLADNDVKLFGIDVPSVDKITSKMLDVHHALHAKNIMIIENIILDDIAPGVYDFIALPLKITGADGSPVRAVIKPKGEKI